MKRMIKLALLIGSFALPVSLLAQKDSIHLVCPLNGAIVVPPPKNGIRYDPPDLCIVLVSVPDTIVKACMTGKVTNVVQNNDEDEDGQWDVVFFSKINNKDYYFWYSGMSRTLVKRNEELKAGQPIGYVKPGGKIELLMYQFETQLDPIKYLDCKGVLKRE